MVYGITYMFVYFLYALQAIFVSDYNTNTPLITEKKLLQKIAFKTVFENSKAKLEFTTEGKKTTLKASNHDIIFETITDSEDFLHINVKHTLKYDTSVMDCLVLSSSSWFGGAEQKRQYWPINDAFNDNQAYYSKELDSAGVSERYWLSSKGVFIYISDRVPLFIHQNTEISRQQLCFEAKKVLPFYVHDNLDFKLEYSIGIASNARLAQMKAVETFLGKPTGIPDTDMVRYPIWSTWVRYGRDIDGKILLEFAKEIKDNGFKIAQLEIDDLWEKCYGSYQIADKFSDIKNVTTTLREQGIATTMWIHPFINSDCQPYYDEAKAKNYLVKSHDGSYFLRWWNSKDQYTASTFDFTNPAVRVWYREQLDRLLQETGIDTFKFDAGESSFVPPDPVLAGPTDFYPSQMTTDFLSTVVDYGPKLEIRVAQGTQKYPVFVRILDFDSRWTWENGLPTLITTVLLFNIVGYPFVLPDMIGGNNYNDDIVTKELYIRWMQANVFLPTLQFSISPWQFDDETTALALKLTKLHEDYADKIIERFNLAVSRGDPVNPPIWWVDPENRDAHVINDGNTACNCFKYSILTGFYVFRISSW